MGRMDSEEQKGNLVRALIYGPPKSRKTWWAMRLAELGFNVILCDLDDGAGIAKVLSPAARKRIFRIDMRPNSEGYSTSGAAALSYAMSGQVVFFDEDTRTYVPVQKIDADREYVRVELSKASSLDVLVIDTWTAFVQQMTGNVVTILSAVKVDKMEWEEYQKVRLLLDHFMGGLTKLNCHSITIAHSETYAKKKPDVDPKGKQLHEIIDSVRIQPTSITRAHAEAMAGKFNEVAFFENMGTTLGVRVDTRGTSDFDAGSRYYPPGNYKFDDFDAKTMINEGTLAQAALNSEFSSEAVTVVKGADVLAERASKATNATIAAPSKPILGSIKKPVTG